MPLTVGEPAPWFTADTPSAPAFTFNSVAGRFILLAFLPQDAQTRAAALQALAAHRALFDDARISAFLVVRDATTAATARDMRGLRWFLDLDQSVSRLYGAVNASGAEQFAWMVLDPSLRVLAHGPHGAAEGVFRYLSALPQPGGHAGVPMHAPTLIVPRIFPADLCQRLIARHAAQGAAPTGVMRDFGDRTLAVMDEYKKRRDILVDDPGLQAEIRDLVERLLFPQIAKVFQFRLSHIERYLVGRYAADEGGIFRAHRDDITHGTAHRRFACSINLNDDFEGGDLRFPEFGPQTYRPPAGGALVFSCSLLHEVTPMRRGERYAFLPFFFDEAGAETRRAYHARIAAAPQPEAAPA